MAQRTRVSVTNTTPRPIDIAGRWIQPGSSDVFDLEQVPEEWRAGAQLVETAASNAGELDLKALRVVRADGSSALIPTVPVAASGALGKLQAGGQELEVGGGKAAVPHSRAMWKPRGSQAAVVEAYNTFNTVMKIEAEAPFSRVRIWVFHRAAYGCSGWRFAVAPTDQWAVDTLQNAFHPRQGATIYNGLQDATNPIGWSRATWGAGGVSLRGSRLNTGEYVGADRSGMLYPGTDFASTWEQSETTNALGDIAVSDWIPCKSVQPATLPPSGVARPFLLLRSHKAGGAFAKEVGAAYVRSGALVQGEYLDWAAGLSTSRLWYVRGYTGGDGVENFSLVPASVGVPNGSTTEHAPYIAVEFDYDVPVRSFGCFGDSNTESYKWPYQAITSISTPQVPYTAANFGMSTCRSLQYFTMLDNVVQRGAPFSDWLIPSHSTNDATNTQLDVDVTKAQILQRVAEAARLGVKPWLWTHFYGVHGPVGTNGNDPEVMAYLDWVRALCATGAATLVDTAAGWVRASMLASDNTHPNEAGAAYMAEVFRAALLAERG